MKLASNRSAQAAGFTLLEVLVAMTIVGVGVVTLLQVFSMGLRLGARSSLQTEALASGRLVLDEILARPSLEDGAQQGTIDDRTRWQLQVQTVRDPQTELTLGSNLELKDLSVSLTVNEGSRERRVEFKTLRLMRKKS